MSPPATATTATTALTLEHIEREGDTDLSSQRMRLRYLVNELGVTRPEAKALIAAYERDLANARRIGNDTHRSDADFLAWLMRQAPTSRNRPVLKHGWRTR